MPWRSQRSCRNSSPVPRAGSQEEAALGPEPRWTPAALPFRRGRQLAGTGRAVRFSGAAGLVLAGRVHIEHLDVWGSKTLLGQAHGGGPLRRDLRLPAPGAACWCKVTAASDGEALVSGRRALLLAPGSAPWRQQLARNLLADRRPQEPGAGAAQPVHRPQNDPRAGDRPTFPRWPVKKRQPALLRSPSTGSSWRTFLGVDRSALEQHAVADAAGRAADVLGRRTVELRTPPETL